MKSDKELAVELVVAMIAANPRVVVKTGVNTETGVPSIKQESVDTLLKHYYQLISKLDNSEAKQ